MPPKSSKKGGNKKSSGFTEADIDKLVAGIESDAPAGAVAVPAGMTKVQQREAEQRRLTEARAQKTQYTPEEIHALYLRQQASREEDNASAMAYTNVEVELPDAQRTWFRTANHWLRFEQFDGAEDKLTKCVTIFNSELSEPYVDFTYMHFILGWPDLCIIAFALPRSADDEEVPAADTVGEFVGAILSSVQRKKAARVLTGYVAMLAVVPAFRKHKIASLLVIATVDLMKKKGCDEVALETPADMVPAVNLYTKLGFIKTKFLSRYYLQGQDAVRLKLFLSPAPSRISASAQQQQQQQQQQQAVEAAAAAETPSAPQIAATA